VKNIRGLAGRFGRFRRSRRTDYGSVGMRANAGHRSFVGRNLLALMIGVVAVACDRSSDATPHCLDLESQAASTPRSFTDDFAGDGPLLDYVTNNAEALPDVARVDGRYRALVTDNADDRTLHFFDKQGRLDARLVAFPFDYVARNVGIGRPDDSQSAPDSDSAETFVFAGVQVHDPNLDARNSSHVVVGHRGATTFTVEGKNTCDGTSRVDDAGPGAAPLGRADLRIVGHADGTLSVHFQQPNLDHPSAPDRWEPYRGTGELPGPAPEYGPTVYIGLITYAAGEAGVPFVGTADAVEAYQAPAG
jgi:hypothetical protein